MMYCRQLSILLCVTFVSHVKVYRKKRTTNPHTIQQLFLFLLLLCYAIYSYILLAHMKAYNKEYNKLLSHISCQFVCVVCKEEGKKKKMEKMIISIVALTAFLFLLSTHTYPSVQQHCTVNTTSYSTVLVELQNYPNLL